MYPGKQGRSFHTDQGKWDRRDFEDSEFDDLFNDNEERVSLEEYPATEEYLDSGHLHSDREIETIIQQIFSKTKLEKQNIKISVKNSNVIFEGSVSSQHEKEMAEKMASLAHGVGQIKNNLKIE